MVVSIAIVILSLLNAAVIALQAAVMVAGTVTYFTATSTILSTLTILVVLFYVYNFTEVPNGTNYSKR